MKINYWLTLGAMVAAGCTSTPTVKEQAALVGSKTVTVLYQSNRLADLEPCGCHYQPFGGIDRETNAIDAIRKEGNPILFVEAGNTYWSMNTTARPEIRKLKSTLIRNILNRDGLDVLAPGPRDYALGLAQLNELKKDSKFAYVSTNVKDAQGKTPYEPYVIVEKGGVNFGIVSATPEDATFENAKMKVEKVSTALGHYLPIVTAKSDVVILLSQLGNTQNIELQKQFPVISIIVGSDNNIRTLDPTWLAHGKTLLLDPANNGNFLGKLKVQFNLPNQGFYSEKVINQTKTQIAYYESRIKKDPKAAEVLLPSIEAIRRDFQLEKPKNGTPYEGELVTLDEKTYGKANDVTQLVNDYRTSLRKHAIGE